MATVSIPSSRQARMTRTAISPRLATRTFLNSFCFMVLTALQRIAGHPRSVAMPLQVDEKGLRAFGPVGALAPRRPIFGLISCAPRSRIVQMRSLRCSEMRPNLDHLDGQLARRPFFINLLVSWNRGSQTKSANTIEDLIGGLHPHKGLGLLVVDGEVETNGVLQGAGAAMSAAAELLLGEGREPALDLVDPGGVGGCVMDLEARMAEEPVLDQVGLVSAVVVEHQVDIEVGRHLLIDSLQEAFELGRAMAAMGLSDHAAGGDVEGGKEGGDAMTPVVMGAPLGHAGSQGQYGLGAVQSLDLGLLVDAEHERGLGRIQIQTDDVAHLRDELGIVGELEVLRPVRLQTEGSPDSAHRGVAEPALFGHAPGAPVSGVPRH